MFGRYSSLFVDPLSHQSLFSKRAREYHESVLVVRSIYSSNVCVNYYKTGIIDRNYFPATSVTELK
jgi:hypothetical protein